MGRRLLPLMMTLLLLTACAAGGEPDRGEELALQIRDSLGTMTGCSCTAHITADYTDRVFETTLDVTYDAATGVHMTVSEPELVRGVTAHLTPDGVTLRYDTVSLELGSLTESGISPFEALPTLYRAASGDYIAAWDLSETALTVTYRDGVSQPGEGRETVVVYDPETATPISAELYRDGTRLLAVELEHFQMMTGAS